MSRGTERDSEKKQWRKEHREIGTFVRPCAVNTLTGSVIHPPVRAPALEWQTLHQATVSTDIHVRHITVLLHKYFDSYGLHSCTCRLTLAVHIATC